MKQIYTLEEAKKFALKHFENIHKKYPKGGLISASRIDLIIEIAVECGFKFGQKSNNNE